MANNKSIEVSINTTFPNFSLDKNNINKMNGALEKLYGYLNCIYLNKDDNRFKNIEIISFRHHAKDDEQKLIYEVQKSNKKDEKGKDIYCISTGLYVGNLNIKNVNIKINTGYNNVLLQRMLNSVSNIYFDNNIRTQNQDKDKNIDFVSLILEYLFLTSLKRAFSMGLPTEYKSFRDQSYSVKGKVDGVKTLKNYLVGNSKINYVYNEKCLVQEIVDVLFGAINTIKKESASKIIENYRYYLTALKQYKSSKKITNETINKAKKHKSLQNQMFEPYKSALKYAELILKHKNMLEDEEQNGTMAISGYLIDISELWEMYLANILSSNLEGYRVLPQEKINIYSNMFFSRNMYPDLVLEKDGNILVLDAKFKKMQFKNFDVDRNDLYQIHTYVGYYNTLTNNRVKLCSLIYPFEGYEASINPSNSALYGIEDSETNKTKFSIEYLKVCEDYNKQIEEERAFCDRLKRTLLD